MQRYISIDSGKSKTKVSIKRADSVEEFSFLTKMDEVNSNETAEENTYIVEYNGKWYRVGDSAVHYAPKDTSKKSECHRIATWTAAALRCDSGDTINIAIGCPLSLYENPKQRTEYRDYMLPSEEIELKIKTTTGIQTKKIKFGIKVIFPEGSGVIYSNPNKYRDKMIAICDLGGLNINVSLYNKLALQHDHIVTKDLGGRILIDKLTEALNAEFNTEISSKIIESKILNPDKSERYIRSEENPVDSKAKSKEFIKKFIIEHIKKIKKECRDGKIDTLNIETHFIGGTSALLKDEIISVFGEDIIFHEHSELINSRGWLTMLCVHCKEGVPIFN